MWPESSISVGLCVFDLDCLLLGRIRHDKNVRSLAVAYNDENCIGSSNLVPVQYACLINRSLMFALTCCLSCFFSG